MYYNNSNGCSRVCVKRGPHGPQGPEGPEGPQGPQGPEGPQGPAGQTVNSLQYSVALEQSGVSTEFILAGVDPRCTNNFVPQEAPGDPQQTYTSDYTTPSFGVYNNHLYITIDSITLSDVSGKITVTGTSISESTSVPVPGDTEDIYITNAPNSYQTLKKWLQVDTINFTNVSSKEYKISILGYVDFLNTSVRITGYRAEILGDGNSTGHDIRLIIDRIKQNDPVTTILPLEDIEVDGASESLNDNLRSGSFDRSYTMTNGATLWPENTDFILKQSDFNDYFTNNENLIESANDEGIIIKVTSTDLGAPNGPTYINLMVYFTIVE